MAPAAASAQARSISGGGDFMSSPWFFLAGICGVSLFAALGILGVEEVVLGFVGAVIYFISLLALDVKKTVAKAAKADAKQVKRSSGDFSPKPRARSGNGSWRSGSFESFPAPTRGTEIRRNSSTGGGNRAQYQQASAPSADSYSFGSAAIASQPSWRGRERPQLASAGPSWSRSPSASSAEGAAFSSCFSTAGSWDDHIQTMLREISPTAESRQVVQRVALEAQRSIQAKCPDARVSGFAVGNPSPGKAFGVAVPEVDIVITATPEALAEWLSMPLVLSEAGTPLEERRMKVNKAAIRACAKQLALTHQLKFRRTQLSVEDPRITMLAPTTVANSGSPVPVDICVNSVTASRMAILLAECTRIDHRARDLILLVKEWARNRGIAHKASSQLSPYSWMLLTIYYLQVAGGRNGFRFPPVRELKRVSGEQKQASTREQSSQDSGSDRSRADLLHGFIDFYCNTFDWDLEAVCPRLGRRWEQGISLRPCLDPEADGALHVEDPFDPKRNVAASLTASSLGRVKEELQRANGICRSGDPGSFTRFFETLLPPNMASGGSSDD